MKNYYEILEVNSDASQSEIKKAYFKMVRKYPPDRYEEKFMTIREAYENLSNEETRRQYDNINNLPEGIRNDYNAAANLIEEEKLSSAIRKLEKILENNPELYIVKALLAETCLKNNNSGKAIKLYEELCEGIPQNSAFVGYLADAYSSRGWNKKAVKEYKRAIKLDRDNIALWLNLSKVYSETNDYWHSRETLENALSIFKASSDSTSIYLALIMINIQFGMIAEIKNYLNELVRLAKDKEDTKANVGWILARIASYLFSIDKNEEAHNVIEKAVEILPQDEKILEFKNKIEMISKYKNDLQKLENDRKIDDGIKCIVSMVLLMDDGMPKKDKEAMEYVSEYEIIKNFSKYKASIRRLEKVYPNLYKMKLDFFTKARDDNSRKKLKKEYEKQYNEYSYIFDKLYDFNIGDEDEFYDDYGFEDEEDDEWGYEDFEVQEPFVREENKIGRNDPCPCGSGKKYKKCCGKNS